MDSADDGLRTLRLTHHRYDDLCDKWTKRAPSPQRTSTSFSRTSAKITKRWVLTYWHAPAHHLYLSWPTRADKSVWAALESHNKWACVPRTCCPYRWRWRVRTTKEFVFSELWWSVSPVTVALGHWRRAKSRKWQTPRTAYSSPVQLNMVSPHGNLREKERQATVDFQALNKHTFLETHHTQSPFHQARRIPNVKRKTVFDAWNGYHSVPIHENDRHKTTFITRWGR